MADEPVRDGPLWQYFRELRDAVERAHAGKAQHPYRSGAFLVHAEADDVELTLRDVSEEDAILVASELRSLGARTVLRAQVPCPSCGHRVPDQAYCVRCRERLNDDDGHAPS